MSVACVLEAVALLRRDTRGVWAAVAGTWWCRGGRLRVGRAIGLPRIADDVGNWTEPLCVVSLAAEAVAVACAGLTLAGGPELTGRRRGPVVAGMLALVLGLSSTAAAALAPRDRAT